MRHLAQLTQSNAALRRAVLHLTTHRKVQLPTIAQLLGVTKGAVNHVIRRAELGAPDELGFANLKSPDACLALHVGLSARRDLMDSADLDNSAFSLATRLS